MPVFAMFLLWPLVEIALFVTLGSVLGLWLTMLIVLGTAGLGILMLRGHGLRSVRHLRSGLTSLHSPLQAAGSDVLWVAAAVLLILPGFLTDALGLLLLLPPVRLAITAYVARRVEGAVVRAGARQAAARAAHRPPVDVIDGDFIEVTPDERRPPSGWTRH